jgi:hypothetical protein
MSCLAIHRPRAGKESLIPPLGVRIDLDESRLLGAKTPDLAKELAEDTLNRRAGQCRHPAKIYIVGSRQRRPYQLLPNAVHEPEPPSGSSPLAPTLMALTKPANDIKSGAFTASPDHFLRDQKKNPGLLFAFDFLMEVPSATQCQLWLCSQTFAVRIRQTANFARTEMSKEVSPGL